MFNKSSQVFCDIYFLNPEINSNQLLNVLNDRLCKAEALALTATTIDFEAHSMETVHNYMWTLSDMLQEARWLYEKVCTEFIT